MPPTTTERIRIATPSGEVSGAWAWPEGATATVVVAHGAGAGMDHPLLVGCTDVLNEAAVGTLRFNFPYMEAGRKSPDRQPAAVAAWRAVHEDAVRRSGGKPVWASGKSFGGRMASHAVAEGMPAAGLVFLGYPLHPPGRPERIRDAHLGEVSVPMLFIQGTDDALARFDLVKDVVGRLGRWATLHVVEGGDHSFRVRGRRQSPEEVGRMLGSVAARFVRGTERA